MFKISPVENAERQKTLAEAVGVPYRPGTFAYGMVNSENGGLMGFSQFEVSAGYGTLLDLAEVPGADDFEAMFILGRSTMNFIDLCGAHLCRATAIAAPERLLRCLGFVREEDGSFSCDMTGMFDGHCSGKPVDLAR